MKWTSFFAIALMAGAVSGAAAQGSTGLMVSGRVFDDTTGCPLRGVVLTAVGATAKTMTDANGRYYLHAVPSSPFALQAMLAGYATQSATNLVVSDTAARVDFSLRRDSSDLNQKPKVRYPSMRCVLDRRDSSEHYDRH